MSDQINIRQFREARRWTQGEMATYFGVNKATVWRWENEGVPARGPARQAIERAMRELAADPALHEQSAIPDAAA
jgi:transcriptional regulator with XRE-family HTH domain